MNEQLDMSGFVEGACGTSAGRIFWSDLSPDVQRIVRAVLEEAGYGDSPERAEARAHRGRGWVCNWTGGYCPSGCGSPCTYKIDSTQCGGGVVVQDYNRRLGFSDLHHDTLARIIADWKRFGERFPLRLLVSYPGMRFWRGRQAGYFEDTFPPVAFILNEEGKVIFQ